MTATTAEDRPTVRYQWSECGVIPQHGPHWHPAAVFSIDVRGRVDASGARRANPRCEITTELALLCNNDGGYAVLADCERPLTFFRRDRQKVFY